MAKKESRLKQAARGATAPFKNVGRDTRKSLGRVPMPQAAPMAPAAPASVPYPNDIPPVDMSDFELIRNMRPTGPVAFNQPAVAMPSVEPTLPASDVSIPPALTAASAASQSMVAPPSQSSAGGLTQRVQSNDPTATSIPGQVDPATVEHWRNLYGPGAARQALDAGSGAYNDSGRIGRISPEEMAAIGAGTADNPIAPRGMGRSSGVGQTGTPTRGYGSQAWNAGSPDTRDLSRIPMPEARVPASVQALPADQLAALQDRLNIRGDIQLSGGPLQNEAAYPDLIAAARAKLAGQDVTPPTVIGSDRYRGGSAEAQQMQRASWARARTAQDARAADQANRMQNDPMTMYRAARAGNPDANLRMQLQALGGANTPAAMGAMFGPGAAIGAMQQQGQNAAVAADLQKAQMEQETVLRATLAPQILNRAAEYVKAGMDPAAAHNQATQEVTAAATQQQLPIPPPQPEQPGMLGQLWGGIRQAWNGGGVGMLPWLGGN